MKVVESIKLIYPSITGGFVYWETNQDGTPHKNPIDGLVWENTEFSKPTWEQIEAQLSIVGLKEVKEAKKAEINAQRDTNINKPIFHSQQGKDHYLKRSIASELSWLYAGNQETDSEWITEDNQIITITKWNFRNISIHLGKRDTQEFILARKRKNEVEKLTSIEAVRAYDITSIPE